MENHFKKGDKVRLISVSHADNETINWIDSEKSCPSIGDVFTVQYDCESADEFVVLEELLLSHPQSKFEFVTPLVHPPTMSAAAFKSMVDRNNMTPKNVDALRRSLQK